MQASIDYIHNNPVARKLCKRAIDWKWSSARHYLLPGAALDPDLPPITPLPPDFWTGMQASLVIRGNCGIPHRFFSRIVKTGKLQYAPTMRSPPDRLDEGLPKLAPPRGFMHMKKHRRLTLEQLESRRVLAGNVEAIVFPDGILRVTGDALANAIDIRELEGANGLFKTFRVAGRPGTTINGGPGPFVAFVPMDSLIVSLKGGNDIVTLDEASSAVEAIVGQFNILTGSGNDRVELHSVRTKGLARIDFGAGNDTLTADNIAANSLNVLGGAGNNTFTLTDVTVVNKATLQGESGNDKATATRLRVGLDASINLGAGVNSLTVVNSRFSAAATIDSLSGNDTITIRGSQANSLLADAGGGANTITLRNVDITGITEAIILKGGADNDTIAVIGGSSANDLQVDALNGDNTISIEEFTATNDVVILGGVDSDGITLDSLDAKNATVIPGSGFKDDETADTVEILDSNIGVDAMGIAEGTFSYGTPGPPQDGVDRLKILGTQLGNFTAEFSAGADEFLLGTPTPISKAAADAAPPPAPSVTVHGTFSVKFEQGGGDSINVADTTFKGSATFIGNGRSRYVGGPNVTYAEDPRLLGGIKTEGVQPPVRPGADSNIIVDPGNTTILPGDYGTLTITSSELGIYNVTLQDVTANELIVRFGSGNEKLILRNVEVSGLTTLDLGAGNNTVDATEGLNTLGGSGIELKSGNGDDKFLAAAPTNADGVFILGTATFNLGGGINVFQMVGLVDADGRPTRAELPDNTVVTTGNGMDTLRLINVKIAGLITLNSGGGLDSVELENVEADRIVTQLGDGEDSLIFKDITAADGNAFGLTVNAGDGHDTLAFTNVHATLYALLGSGNDDFTLNNEDDFTSNFLSGEKLIVKGEDGDDSLKLTKVIGTTVLVDAGDGNNQTLTLTEVKGDTLDVRAGSGNDVLNLTEIGFNKKLTVDTKAGDDIVVLDSINLSVDLAEISINLGDGADRLRGTKIEVPTLHIDAGLSDDADDILNLQFFVNNLAVRLGGGDDKIKLLNGTLTSTSTLIDGGDGDDELRVEFNVALANPDLRSIKVIRIPPPPPETGDGTL